MTSQPKERPILFSAAMVRAILDGRKTQTRRIMKPQPDAITTAIRAHPSEVGRWQFQYDGRSEWNSYAEKSTCPYGVPGDRIWAKETWKPCFSDGSGTMYRADVGEPDQFKPWKPSIFMPRARSRILLEITGIRAERLHDISADDCRAEGHPVTPLKCSQEVHDEAAHEWYMDLWIDINGLESWKANPWVWVVEFSRIKP